MFIYLFFFFIYLFYFFFYFYFIFFFFFFFFFVFRPACRFSQNAPAVDLFNAGWMAPAVNWLADANGGKVNVFTDDVIALNGYYSIVGRSVVLHDSSTAAAVRIAQCVIGRNDTPADEVRVPKTHHPRAFVHRLVFSISSYPLSLVRLPRCASTRHRRRHSV